ncbi:hypothetical protein ACL02T_01765 [Pseudonocardia sp. RS010]|uniref:hypothetical protein n=1 Tax=Pseudonocardia sp. RS010 TaxID=3385979 RepID=UPI00399F5138
MPRTRPRLHAGQHVEEPRLVEGQLLGELRAGRLLVPRAPRRCRAPTGEEAGG